MAEQWLSKEQVDAQLKFLGIDEPPALFTLKDWSRRKLTERQRGVGGRGKRAEFHPTTAADWFAGNALLLAAEGMGSKEQLRYVREMALLIEGCQTPEDVLAVARGFGHMRGNVPARHLATLGADIVFYLRQRRKALRKLYGKTQPEQEKKRDEYFGSDVFVRLVWGLVSGFYDGYSFDKKGNLVRPKNKELPETEQVLKDFASETPKTLAAKGR